MKAEIEIACFTLESAVLAAQSGANRIEFCSGFEVGGTTPNIKATKNLLSKTNAPVYVMIRPRGGNFNYTETEFQTMKRSIYLFKEMNVQGFVFGILNKNNTVDNDRNKELVTLCQPFPCTFHRAFDEVLDTRKALEDIISCGFKTILTSGTKVNVVEGVAVLKSIIAQAKNRIIIMPGGGLRSSNLKKLHQELQTTFYHSSAITDASQMVNPNEIEKLKSILNE